MFLATLVLSFLSSTDCKLVLACDLQNSGFSSSTEGEKNWRKKYIMNWKHQHAFQSFIKETIEGFNM